MHTTTQFFSLLFPELSKGQIEIREIGEKNTQKFFRSVNELSLYEPPTDRNIYFGVYQKGFRYSGKAENCKFTNAIYLDFDKMTLPEINNRLKKENLPKPSIIVNSGNGYHLYWLLSKPAYDVSSLLKRMATKTGADIKATDKARILRFPDTLNYKYDPPKKCEIYSINNNKYKIELFQELFPEPERKENKQLNFPKVNRACIRNMLEGVSEGNRNFALGRITKFFQQQGYDKDSVKQIILNWNRLNKPPEKERELLNSFYHYWKNDYKLLGCRIDNIELQALLSRFCDRDKCKMKFWGSKLIYSQSFDLNNRIFNNYKNVSGYEITIYGLLARHPEGLTTSQIKSKMIGSTGIAGIGRNNRRKALRSLIGRGFIKVVYRSKRAGKQNLYCIKRQGSFGTGFTIINNGVINGVIDRRITAGQLKLYVLLNKYYCKGLSLPSLTSLAKVTGTSQPAISRILRTLERVDFIKRSYIHTEKKTMILVCELLI